MAKYEIAFDDKREEVSVYLVRNGSCFTNPPEVIQLEPTPYIEPDMELLADEAHGIGFNEGYEQGIRQGRKEVYEAIKGIVSMVPDDLESTFGDYHIPYISNVHQPDWLIEKFEIYKKHRLDVDVSTAIEKYGYDGVTEVLRKMIESEKE